MFVHHIWGNAPELHDAILLAPPPTVTRHLTEIKIKIRDLEPGEGFTPPPQNLDFSQIRVFKENDLKEDIKLALTAAKYVIDLHSLFSPVAELRDTTRAELLNRPRIRLQYEKFCAQGSP